METGWKQGVLALWLGCAALPLMAAGAHEHGVARVTVVVSGGAVEIGLETPLDNLTGFEHAPQSAAQRAALDEALAALRRNEGLLAPEGEDCQLQEVDVRSPFDADHPHAPGGEARAGHADEGGHEHADLDARWLFQCPAGSVSRVQLKIFQRFSGLQRLRVDGAVEARQWHQELKAGEMWLIFPR